MLHRATSLKLVTLSNTVTAILCAFGYKRRRELHSTLYHLNGTAWSQQTGIDTVTLVTYVCVHIPDHSSHISYKYKVTVDMVGFLMVLNTGNNLHLTYRGY